MGEKAITSDSPIVTSNKEHSYIILVDNDEEIVLVIKHVPEMESGETSENSSLLIKEVVSKKILRLFAKLSSMCEYVETGITPLSHRQIEILTYIAEGHPNKVIANILGIGEQTIKNYVTSIKNKLEANDRTQAVVLAMRNGWLNMQ